MTFLSFTPTIFIFLFPLNLISPLFAWLQAWRAGRKTLPIEKDEKILQNYLFKQKQSRFAVLSLILFIIQSIVVLEGKTFGFYKGLIWLALILLWLIQYAFILWFSLGIEERIREPSWDKKKFFTFALRLILFYLIPLLSFACFFAIYRFLFRSFPFLNTPIVPFFIFSLSLLLFYFLNHLAFPLLNPLEEIKKSSLRTHLKSLALKSKVNVGKLQLMILGKANYAQAWAVLSLYSQPQIVITDYLFDNLTEKETIAILAHEIAHIKQKWFLKGLLGMASFLILVYFFTVGIRLSSDTTALIVVTSYFLLRRLWHFSLARARKASRCLWS